MIYEDNAVKIFSQIPDNSVIVFGDREIGRSGATVELLQKRLLTRIDECISYMSHDLHVDKVIDGTVSTESSDWLEGIPCELLQPGRAWRSGILKLKISTEFIPDILESEIILPQNVSTSSVSPSLDDIRNSIETN